MDVGQQDDRSPRAGGPVFDLVISKMHRPLVRPGTVRRPLLERLARADGCPIVSLVAPAGYGKTTLLAQWAEANGQAFAWVSVEEPDNDPKVLLTYVAEALDEVEPIDKRVFAALASPGSSVPGSVVPRLGSAFSSMSSPVVLVLDDVHVLRNSECRAALSVLADHVPGGSRLALAGRGQPPLRVARLRAEGKILEIGPHDLSLTYGEATSLLRNAGVALGEDEVAELHRRTEGWAAGLYLAALYLREGGPLGSAAVSFGGDDRLVSEYLESEFLARIPQRERTFLTRTAVLERMCGPLCDAVLEQGGSAGVLAQLAGSNLLLVPLDRRGEWYRYHHLFRDMLLAELHRLEPGLMPVLQRHAAAWCRGNGLAEEALEYSMAAGDVDTVAELAERLAVLAYRQGRAPTVRRWFGWLEERGGNEGHPMIAVLASMLSAAAGRPAETERWADAVDRWQYADPARPDDPTTEAWAVMIRAFYCRHGVEQMRADADEAVRRFAAESFASPTPALTQGIARVLSGDLDGGDASLEDAASLGETLGSPEDVVMASFERSLVAMARGEWDQAEAFADQANSALRRAGGEDSYATPLVCAAQARIALHRADLPAVRQHLVTAQRTRPLLTYAVPYLALQVRIELARVYLALADVAAARTLMREIDDLLRRRPSMGTLTRQASELRAQLSTRRESGAPGASALTAAELRLLPLLSTHLSMPEIAHELFLSRYTIKSQANSIYRKLGVSSRNQAVSQSRQLGLLEG
jgi:LuxR family maltose regulon positive regulatory protein